MHRRFSSMRSKARFGLIVAAVGLALAAAGCGGGGGGGNEAADNGGGEMEAKEVRLESGEFYFEPSEINVSQGQKVTLVVTNNGNITHNISIDEFDVTKDYPPGESASVTFTPDRTGTFQIYCDEPGHTESGMVAELIVK